MISVPFGQPWVNDDDRSAVLEVLDGPVLTHGPRVKAFEDDFARYVGPGGHALALSSATAALHLSYLALGIGPGDEVIVPAQTHVATAHAVELVGARPVFVDCDPRTGNVVPAAVEAAVTPATKAISVVHFLGIPCDMTEIMAIAERRRLRVVEDCALALGTRLDGKHAGLFGDTGCFSFYPVKHITTGDGGMLLTRDGEIARRIEKLRAFGVDRTFAQRSIPGMYDVPTLGMNYRLSEMNGALGRSQLNRIDENLARRKRNFADLRKAFEDVKDVSVIDSPGPRHVNSHYCLSIVLGGELATRRDDIVRRLNEAGIGTSVYYPHPVPRLSYYRAKYGYDAALYPNAARISDASIALPVGPTLTREHVNFLAQEAPRIVQGN